jgi:hypothetical protein
VFGVAVHITTLYRNFQSWQVLSLGGKCETRRENASNSTRGTHYEFLVRFPERKIEL